MPESRTLVCGPSPDRMAPPDALEMLKQVKIRNSTKCVITNGKFDTQKAAKTLNIDGGYSPDAPRLQTLAAWAGVSIPAAEQFADGHELFALRAALKRDGPFQSAVLHRGTPLGERWSDLREKLKGKLFLALAGGNVLFDLEDERAPVFLERAWDLYASGSVYAMDDYSFERALSIAAEAVRLEREFATD